MRLTPYTWRYLMPIMLLPAAALVFLALHRAQAAGADMPVTACQVDEASVDGGELLLEFVGAQELQRQAQHQVDTLFE